MGDRYVDASDGLGADHSTETTEPSPAEMGSEGTDKALKDTADLAPDASLPDEGGETSELTSAQELADSTKKAAEDKADTEPDAAPEEETGDRNELAPVQEVAKSSDKATHDKGDAESDAALEEETGDANEPAATQEVADNTGKAAEDKADTGPDSALEEETSDATEPLATQEVTDSTEKAAQDKADTEPDAALEEETGDTSQPAAAQEVADSTEKAAKDKAETGSDAAPEEEMGEVKEPAFAKEVGDSTGKAADGKTETDNPSEAPLAHEERQADSRSDTDVQRARDMVPPEEYSRYKNLYDMLDNRERMPISQEYKKFLTDKFRNMDVDTKKLYDKYAPGLRCADANYVEYNNKGVPQDAAHFKPSNGTFKFNQGHDLENNPLGKGYDYFHESAHNIDWLGAKEGQGRLSKGLSETVREDLRNTIEHIKQEKHCDDLKAMDELGLELGSSPDTSHTVADVFRGAGLSEVPGFDGKYEFTEFLYHHDNTYWKNPALLGQEAFAGIVADRACGNEEALSCARRYMPRTTEAADRIIRARGGL